MVFHPRARRPRGPVPGGPVPRSSDSVPWHRQMSRRDVLRWTAGTAALATVLAACGDNSTGSDGAAAVKVGTPENPVTHPITDDNPPIESGLEIEDGPLRIFNWDEYLHVKVLKDFAAEFGVDYEVTTFYNMEEATRKLRTGDLAFDVFFPTAEVIPKFVAGGLLQPLNHDYLANLELQIDAVRNPYYDQESRYTVPYTLYQTGIGWRADIVDIDPSTMENPWEVLWDPAHTGKVGLYDDPRETIGVGLYKSGINDINTGDPDHIAKAQEALTELVDLVNVRYTIDGAYSGLPEGRFGVHHAWSGDMVGAPWYAPKGQDPTQLRYFWPPHGSSSTAGGYVSNDSMAIPKNAEHPVLAHTFMNYMMSEKASMKNFGWLGYQPPLASIDPASLVADGWVPEYLESAVISDEDFAIGQRPIQLEPAVEKMWLDAFSEAKSG